MKFEEALVYAEKLHRDIDWSKYPKLASQFQHRPCINDYWIELTNLIREMIIK